jgi:hypothetical protein
VFPFIILLDYGVSNVQSKKPSSQHSAKSVCRVQMAVLILPRIVFPSSPAIIPVQDRVVLSYTKHVVYVGVSQVQISGSVQEHGEGVILSWQDLQVILFLIF